MKIIQFAFWILFVTFVTNAALAQNQSSQNSNAVSLRYPEFAAGARVERIFGDDLDPALLELNLSFSSRFVVFALTGFNRETQREQRDNVDWKFRNTAFLVGGGARLNFTDPAPSSAHLYMSIDAVGALGFVYDDDDESDESNEIAEDSLRENTSRLLLGAAIGTAYRFSANFSLGGEIGVKLVVNGLKDDRRYANVDVDKARRTHLGTNLVLRVTYHF